MIAQIDTPSGRIWVCGGSSAVSSVSWNTIKGTTHSGELDWFLSALTAYFDKTIKTFPGGLCFQQGVPVWSRRKVNPVPETLFQKTLCAIASIPYGDIAAYSDIAVGLGNRYLARAVGQACGKNPLPVVVPCHRVVGRHGLGGFGSGIARKKILLELEKNFPEKG